MATSESFLPGIQTTAWASKGCATKSSASSGNCRVMAAGKEIFTEIGSDIVNALAFAPGKRENISGCRGPFHQGQGFAFHVRCCFDITVPPDKYKAIIC